MTETISPSPEIAIVIPCYRVKAFILGVIASIPREVSKIYVVDDACPEGSGAHVRAQCSDTRVRIVFNQVNLGVGGAVIEGYRKALEDRCAVIIKMDGDGQMDGMYIRHFVRPILEGQADYVKGNRFYNPYFLRRMPRGRLLGNALLSFVTKLSSGYWDIFDPANGYTAISAAVLRELPLDKLNRRYFFESDMLFRLNIIRAVVIDIPLEAVYGEEKSNLYFTQNIGPFFKGNVCNFFKRIFYNYYLRNFALASLQLVFGLLLTAFGMIFGAVYWLSSIEYHQPATAGTVMVAALPIIVGFQLLMSFLNYDISSVPRRPLTGALQSRVISPERL